MKRVSIPKPEQLETMERPECVRAYFDRFGDERGEYLLERDATGFSVSYNDPGRRRFSKRFDGLAEAVAEHVLVRHGMY